MSRDTRIVAAFLAAIALVILGSAVACTWVIAHGASMAWALPFRLLCHGFPRRCFELFGAPMPICARCTGIYAGLAAGIALFAVKPVLRERLLRIGAFAAATPLLVDGLTQAAGLRESTNALRVGTGLAAAFVFAMWVLSAVETQVRRRVTSP